MKQKFYLNRYNIPELNRKEDHYTTSGNKDNAVHNFAVIITKKRYSNDKWKTKLKDVKKEIFPYVNIVKENMMKKSELKQIIKEEIKNIIIENKYWLGDVPQKDDFGNKITNIFIDGATYTGVWAIMAPIYWKSFGVGLGTGKGQMYKKQSDNKWLKIKG